MSRSLGALYELATGATPSDASMGSILSALGLGSGNNSLGNDFELSAMAFDLRNYKFTEDTGNTTQLMYNLGSLTESAQALINLIFKGVGNLDTYCSTYSDDVNIIWYENSSDNYPDGMMIYWGWNKNGSSNLYVEFIGTAIAFFNDYTPFSAQAGP